ncbi:putative DNA-binding protein with PD1-like motif [Bradyrhizobium sp. GM6.1]
MKRQTFSGKMEEIIYARLNAGEDLLPAIWDICKQHDVKTGVLLDATGSMETVRLQRFPHQARKGSSGIDIVEILGQLEVSAHGIIGLGWSPDKPVTVPQELVPFSHGPNSLVEHEGPYCHVHIVVSSASQTVCGHLMEGSQICRNLEWES